MKSSEILTKVLDYLDVTQTAFGEKAGISKQAITAILKGDYDLSSKNAERIKTAYPELNLDFLISGKGSLLVEGKGPRLASDAKFVDVDTMDTVEVPFVSMKVRAGFESSLEGIQVTKLTESFPVRVEYIKDYPRAIVMEIAGDSMEPRLKEGDKVLIQRIDPSHWQIQHNGVYVVEYDGVITIKRILRNDLTKGELTLHPDNTAEAQAVTIQAEWIRAIWKVIKIVDTKRI